MKKYPSTKKIFPRTKLLNFASLNVPGVKWNFIATWVFRIHGTRPQHRHKQHCGCLERTEKAFEMQLFSEKNPLSAVGCKIIKGIHTFRLQFSQKRKNLAFTLQLETESFVKWKFVPVHDSNFNLCMRFTWNFALKVCLLYPWNSPKLTLTT